MYRNFTALASEAMPADPIRVMLGCTIRVIALVAALLTASQSATAQPNQSPATIEQLIADLGHPDFPTRQAAVEQLAQTGPEAIAPLIQRLLDCNPETCNQIKTALFQLAEGCEEENLFKILAVLKIRFQSPSAEIQPLLTNWAVAARQRVIARWRSTGADVVDPYEAYIAEGLDDMVRFRGPIPQVVNRFAPRGVLEIQIGGLNVIPPTPMEVEEPEEKVPAPDTDTDSSLPLRQRLENVISATAAENIQMVIGSTDSNHSFSRVAAEIRSFPVNVVINEKWNGQIADLSYRSPKSLPIARLELTGQTLDNRWGNFLKTHPIEYLSLTACQLDDNVDSSLLPPTVNTVAIKETKTPAAIISKFATPGNNINQLELINTKFDDVTYQAVRELALVSLQLEGLDLSQQNFSQLRSLRELRLLSLNRCRFQAPEFRKFEDSVQGRIRLTFTAKAFLGVRGNGGPQFFNRGGGLQPNPFGDPGIQAAIRQPHCEITEVVPGSAAAAAGVQAGDNILALGKQKVTSFADLRVLIAQYGAGDTISIEVDRNGKKVKLETTLGDFADSQ